MATLLQTVRDIKSLKIQGAQNIAEAGLQAWKKAKNKEQATKLLISARPTEPMLFNAIHAANSGLAPDDLIKRFKLDEKKIAEIGAKLIRDGMVVFTHCHSSTVTAILKEAKKQGRQFEVNNTETRPLFQGRITAKELAKARIKVHHYIDSAAMEAMKNVDIFLMGADAITENGIYNKIGSDMFAGIAATHFKIPVHSCAHSWKYSHHPIKIEQRAESEVWRNAPRRVNVKNPAFELVEKGFLTGIISQLGVLDYTQFLKRVKLK